LVFRDNDDDFIRDALETVGADVVQIHGPLSDALLTHLRATDVLIVRALPIGSDEFFDFDEGRVDAVLIDGATPGSGVSHSWVDLTDRTFVVPIIAAGGLTDVNVASVIAHTGVWGVDCASGVESLPGIKDRDKLNRFIDNAREAFRERAAT
jgi:phosphoribosylanthranilate isomerase